jgi:hypothetical protein
MHSKMHFSTISFYITYSYLLVLHLAGAVRGFATSGYSRTNDSSDDVLARLIGVFFWGQIALEIMTFPATPGLL